MNYPLLNYNKFRQNQLRRLNYLNFVKKQQLNLFNCKNNLNYSQSLNFINNRKYDKNYRNYRN